MGSGILSSETLAAIDNTERMRITKIESVKFREGIKIGGGSGGSDGAEFCWLRIHTDKGIIGTGETYPFSSGELGTLKDYAGQLIKKDPRDIEGIWQGNEKCGGS
jgi:L-alanine-DL-glutamate epimerase-like enolase superfamily enzyme